MHDVTVFLYEKYLVKFMNNNAGKKRFLNSEFYSEIEDMNVQVNEIFWNRKGSLES